MSPTPSKTLFSNAPSNSSSLIRCPFLQTTDTLFLEPSIELHIYLPFCFPLIFNLIFSFPTAHKLLQLLLWTTSFFCLLVQPTFPEVLFATELTKPSPVHRWLLHRHIGILLYAALSFPSSIFVYYFLLSTLALSTIFRYVDELPTWLILRPKKKKKNCLKFQ